MTDYDEPTYMRFLRGLLTVVRSLVVFSVSRWRKLMLGVRALSDERVKPSTILGPSHPKCPQRAIVLLLPLVFLSPFDLLLPNSR